jgi:hypothetical protein
LAVRMHPRKSKIHLSDHMQSVCVWKALQTIHIKIVRNKMSYMIRCALISSFQRWKPQVYISFLEKVIKKKHSPLFYFETDNINIPMLYIYGGDQLDWYPKIQNRKWYYSRKDYIMNFIPNQSSSKMGFIGTK